MGAPETPSLNLSAKERSFVGGGEKYEASTLQIHDLNNKTWMERCGVL